MPIGTCEKALQWHDLATIAMTVTRVSMALLGLMLFAPLLAAQGSQTQRYGPDVWADQVVNGFDLDDCGYASSGVANFCVDGTQSFVSVVVEDDSGRAVAYSILVNDYRSQDGVQLLGTFCGPSTHSFSGRGWVEVSNFVTIDGAIPALTAGCIPTWTSGAVTLTSG